MQQFSDYLQLCQFIIKRFIKDDCLYRAAALTLTSLLSLVPLLVVSLAIFNAFPVFKAFSAEIQDFVFKNFLPAFGDVAKPYINEFVHQASRLPAIGMIFLIITAVLVLFTMEETFNLIWRVKKRRQGVAAFLLYWAILTLSPILLGLSLVISSYIISLPLILDTANYLGIYSYLLSAVAFLLAFISLTLIYVALPNCSVKFRHGAIGALIATLLFGLAKDAFAFYLINFPTYHLLYGALAVLPIFIVWVYLLWIIILFGAVISYALTYRKSIHKSLKLDGFSHALLWLHQLAQAQQQNRVLDLASLVHSDEYAYKEEPEAMIYTLIKSGLVRTTEGGYILARNLNNLNVYQLCEMLPWRLPDQSLLTNYSASWAQKLITALTAINTELASNFNESVLDLFEESHKNTT